MGHYKNNEIYIVDKSCDILVHIHIPRTGGQYVSQFRANKTNTVVDNVTHLGHAYVIEDKSDFPQNPMFPENRFIGFHGIIPLEMIVYPNLDKQHTFSIIRNPFDMLVSIFIHWTSDDDINNFRIWLSNIAVENRYEWPNKRFLHTQLFTDKGSWFCDWICRTETLDNDLEAMAKYYNLEYTPNMSRRNVSNKKDYRLYYTDELVDLVYKTWGREIDIFGYHFGGVMYDTSNEFHGLISEETKKKYRYVYISDTLYGGKYIV